MLNKLIQRAVEKRAATLALTAGFLIFGVHALTRLKVEAFPVILYGQKHWQPLVDFMRNLSPHFIDREDAEIFKVVDDPEECVKIVKAGIKKHWWKPLDDQLSQACGHEADAQKNPLAGARATDTGEGTRYGRRAHRTKKPHAAAPKKPQQ